MPLSVLSADNLLDAWGTTYGKFISLHSAYSSTGANEITGGSPAYARLAATWSSAAGNVKALSAALNLNVAAGLTVAWVGFWDAVSGGNFQGMVPAGNQTGFTYAAASATSTLLAPGSSYAATQQVVVLPTGGSAAPSGLTVGTTYFVKSPSGDSFQLAATSGGAAITLTSDGSGMVQAIIPEAFGSQGVFNIPAGTWNLV